MGKIGSIIAATVGIAVQVIPGVGQFIGGTLIGGALAGAGVYATTAFAIGTTIASGLGIYGLTTAFSLVASIFTPGAPKPEPAARQHRGTTPLRTYIRGVRRSYGSLIFFGSTSGGSSVDVVAYMDGRAQSIERVYLNDNQVTVTGGTVQQLADGAYKGGKVKAGYSLGLPTETAFPAVISALPGIWTENHRGDGVVTGYLIKQPVQDKEFLDTYPQGDSVNMSLVIKTWHLFDPREAGQDWGDDETWTGPFDNPVLGLLWYLVVERGEDYATRILPVIDHWTAAADICDSARALKAGGTEKMYRCALFWDASAKPSEVIAEHLKTFDGWMGEDGDGHILVYAGKLYTPIVTIGPDQITDYEVKNFVEDEDRLNEVVITYISDQHDYNSVEASAWRDESDIAERGRIVSTTFEPQVPSHAQAQYLTRRLAAKTNAPYSGTVSTNFSGRSVIGHRYIMLNVVEAGATFFSGRVEIMTVERNPQTGGVVFTWIAVPDALDNWNPALNEGNPAPVGEYATLDPLDTPTIASAEPNFDAGYARIAIEGAGPDRDDLTWFARTRIAGETAWFEAEYTDTDPGTPVALITGPVASNTDIEVEIAYSTGDGRVSPWSATETVDTTAP